MLDMLRHEHKILSAAPKVGVSLGEWQEEQARIYAGVE